MDAKSEAVVTVRYNGEVIALISEKKMYRCDIMDDEEIANLINRVDKAIK